MTELSSRGLPTKKELRVLESYARDNARKEREKRERENDAPIWTAVRARSEQ